MRAAPELVDAHFATGYASDDEVAPARKRRPEAFGALPGDVPGRHRLTEQEVLEYGIRQASGGPKGTKPHFLDSLKGRADRLAPCQTKPRTSYDKHLTLMSLLPRRLSPEAELAAFKSDRDLLREGHRFLRSEEDDDGSWESNLAKRYYDRLFKEYVICDLTGYKKGNVGFRWRTEAEVYQGRGHFHCGHKHCSSRVGLKSYEVDFKYSEAGQSKRALVKARLCEKCAYKLHYKRLKAQRKKRAREAVKKEKEKRSKRRRGEVVDLEEEDDSDEFDEDGGNDAASSAGGPDAREEREPEPTKEDRRHLESLAWRGPDPETRTRADDFDDYLKDLFM